MPMTVVDNQQERMTYIALISKALLHESWASNSILLYIEMIMNVETLKGFVAPTAPKLDELQQLNPASMINYENTSRKTIKEYGEYGKNTRISRVWEEEANKLHRVGRYLCSFDHSFSTLG